MMEAPQTALQQRDAPEADRLFNRMGMDGWKDFLATVSRPHERAFYAYLASAEGRGPRGSVQQDSAPLLSRMK